MEKTRKNEVTAVAKEKSTVLSAIDRADFNQLLQSSLGVSPLAYGDKFESDDLVNAKAVTLTAYDFVSYTENAGTAKERDVRFAVWRATIIDDDDVQRDGYVQGGLVLTKLADVIEDKGLQAALEQFGVNIECTWGKTSSNNNILQVKVI